MMTERGNTVTLSRRRDGEQVILTIDGQRITMSMSEWSQLLATPAPYPTVEIPRRDV